MCLPSRQNRGRANCTLRARRLYYYAELSSTGPCLRFMPRVRCHSSARHRQRTRTTTPSTVSTAAKSFHSQSDSYCIPTNSRRSVRQKPVQHTSIFPTSSLPSATLVSLPIDPLEQSNRPYKNQRSRLPCHRTAALHEPTDTNLRQSSLHTPANPLWTYAQAPQLSATALREFDTTSPTFAHFRPF